MTNIIKKGRASGVVQKIKNSCHNSVIHAESNIIEAGNF